MLLTRAPLSTTPKDGFSFDLHVLSLPPAFVLSQDQTLKLRDDHQNPRRRAPGVHRVFNSGTHIEHLPQDSKALRYNAGCPMRRRHCAAACASLQHLHFQTACAKYRRPAPNHSARTQPTQIKLSIPELHRPGTVYQTAPGGILYGEPEPIVNETDLVFVPKPESHWTLRWQFRI